MPSGTRRAISIRLDGHELEAHIGNKLTAHDRAIAAILSEIRQLTNPPTPKQRPSGFTANLREDNQPHPPRSPSWLPACQL